MSITPGLLQNESFVDFRDEAVRTMFAAIEKQKHPQCPDAKYVFLLVVLHDIKLMVVLHDIKLMVVLHDIKLMDVLHDIELMVVLVKYRFPRPKFVLS